jgi:hypothetical protein
MTTDENGMKRSDVKPMFRKIPAAAMRRLALALTKGSINYDEGLYDKNWQKATPESAAACYDHAIDHLLDYIEGVGEEDALAHAMANIAFMIWYEEQGVYDPRIGNVPPVEEDVVEDVEEESEPIPPSLMQKMVQLAKNQGLLKK